MGIQLLVYLKIAKIGISRDREKANERINKKVIRCI